MFEKRINELNERMLEHNTRLLVAVHSQGQKVHEMGVRQDQLQEKLEETREDLIEYVSTLSQPATFGLGSLHMELSIFSARTEERVTGKGINPK